MEDDKEGVMAKNTKMKFFSFLKVAFFGAIGEVKMILEVSNVQEGWGIEASVH